MSEKRVSKAKKQNSKPKTTSKKGISKTAKILIVGILILCLPILVFGGVLLSAYLANRNPVVGSRFAGDLDPQISESQMETIKTNIEAFSEVESCDVRLTTSQLRINIDTNNTITVEAIEELAKKAYDNVNSVCKVSEYFTSTSEKKMYDLSISLFNFVDRENESMIYYLVTKNSNMTTPSYQLVSEPLDEELAKELRGELEVEETPGGENVQVNPEDLEVSENGETEE